MKLSILPAQPADYARILSLLQHVKLLTDDILVAGSRYWIAQTEDRDIAGCAGIELGTDAVLFRSMAVYETYRGKGLALQLIQHAMNEAQSAGYHHMYCFSTRAADYFQRIGFNSVPVTELAQALPTAPQVVRFTAIGKLAGERAWHKIL